MFGTKRFRSNPTLDPSLHPTPPNLKRALNLVGDSFNSFFMRNLEIMDTSEKKLYGHMTHYESHSFCWIQPTRIKTQISDPNYHNYLKRINRDARHMNLKPLFETGPGRNCVAQYEVDHKWYRAIVVSEMGDDFKWLVLFIDYGNFQRCSDGQLAEIVTDPKCDHFTPPMQAVCCRIYNVVPRHQDSREEIDIQLEGFFTKHSDKFLEIVVKNIRPDFVVDCDVYVCNKEVIRGRRAVYRKHIGQELVDSGVATFANPMEACITMVEPTRPAECITIDYDESPQEADVKMDPSSTAAPNVPKNETEQKHVPPSTSKFEVFPNAAKTDPGSQNHVKTESGPQNHVKTEPGLANHTESFIKGKLGSVYNFAA